jgi:hypothetical protein
VKVYFLEMENKTGFRKEKMMKKLLALTLVLGFAAAANAVYITAPSPLECPVGSSIDIVISSDGSNYSGYIELTDLTAASMTGVDAGAAVRGSLGGFEDDTATGYAGNFHFIAAGPVGAGAVADAAHFTFTYTANDDSSLVTINFYQEDWASELLPSIQVQNTPEPMTLGLLGLGGLFLRRRK